MYQNFRSLYPAKPYPFWLLGLILLFSLTTYAQPAQTSSKLEINKRFDFNDLEVMQRFGIRQVGEENIQPVRRVAPPKPQISGPAAQVLKANNLAEQGDFDRAISLYNSALKSDPKLADARIGLGYILVKQGKFDEAITQYQTVISQTPNNLEAQINLGVAFYQGGRIDEAITQYQKTIADERSSYPFVHFNLAMAYAHEGELDKSLVHYQLAIDQNGKKYPEAYNNLGLVQEALGKFSEAEGNYLLAIKQDSTYALAHYNLARCYYAQQANYQQAIGELQTAIKLNRNFPEAYLLLGNLYLLRTSLNNTGEFEMALNNYKQAIQLRNNFYPLAHENLAIVFSRQMLQAEALAEYRIAFEQYKGQSAGTFYNIINTIVGKPSFTIDSELSRSDNPGNIKNKKRLRLNQTTQNNQQSILDSKEELRGYLADYQKLDDELKTLPDSHYCAGLAYIFVGDAAAALEEFSQALTLSNNKDRAAQAKLQFILQWAF